MARESKKLISKDFVTQAATDGFRFVVVNPNGTIYSRTRNLPRRGTASHYIAVYAGGVCIDSDTFKPVVIQPYLGASS